MDVHYSHYGRIKDRKDMGKYIKYVLKDAKEAFFREHDKSNLEGLNKSDERSVFNVGASIANMIKKVSKYQHPQIQYRDLNRPFQE